MYNIYDVFCIWGKLACILMYSISFLLAHLEQLGTKTNVKWRELCGNSLYAALIKPLQLAIGPRCLTYNFVIHVTVCDIFGCLLFMKMVFKNSNICVISNNAGR